MSNCPLLGPQTTFHAKSASTNYSWSFFHCYILAPEILFFLNFLAHLIITNLELETHAVCKNEVVCSITRDSCFNLISDDHII